MRIAIYHPWVYLKSGLERTLMELHRRSRHRWTIYTSHYDAAGTYPELQQMGVREMERVSVDRRYGAVLGAAWSIARTRLDASQFDALMISCDGLGSLLNFRNHDKPVICLCFTPLRAVYDEEYRARHVGRYRWLRPLVQGLELGYRFIDRLAWRHYRHAFAITDTVRQRIVRGSLFPAEGIDVAYAGVAIERMNPSNTFERFFFVPGRIMWTKNLELAIDAFRLFLTQGGPQVADFELVIGGMVDRKSQAYFERLRGMAADLPQVRFVTDLTDSAMDALYHRCHALLFTAFNEDQGLTPLEGGMHAKPVIAVNRGGPTEIVRHEVTGLLVEPEPQAFAQAMSTLANDEALTRRLGAAALERSKLFTWDAFVERIDTYLDGLERETR